MSQENNHNCNCGHEHSHDEHHECGCGGHSHDDVEKMYLTLENGEDLVCEVIGVFDVDGKEYIALLPEGSEEVYLYGYKVEDDNPVLTQIESDEEYERVGKTFIELCE